MFKEDSIRGVVIHPLKKFTDQRGWLIETFRHDELHPDFFPAMGYISVTDPQIVRGPHEHVDQADFFAFVGPSTFRIYMWDNRNNSPTFGNRMTVSAGADHPMSIIIPPGIVHAYKNIGSVPGVVLNFPNHLYAGKGKKEKVDEIRHEDDPKTIFILD